MRRTASRSRWRRVLVFLGRCGRVLVIALAAMGPAPPPPPPPEPARIEARQSSGAKPEADD